MFDFLKGKKKTPEDKTPSSKQDQQIHESQNNGETADNSEGGLFNRLRGQLRRTRQNFSSHLSAIFLGKKTIDAESLEQLEELLLTSDVGIPATREIITGLTEALKRNSLQQSVDVEQALKQYLINILKPCERILTIPKIDTPYVILMIGVNGSGKTTSIGKITYRLQKEGNKVILAAGDTFRAAAIEQLKVLGDRNNIPVIAQHTGADSASVIFDAYQAASARKIDILIADTAGRLHTQANLMEELKKIARVLKKLDPSIPQEVILVLDASIGQNALIQAQKFHEAMNVTGIIITKLDGTAKGGILFNIAKTLKLPILFIGVGEQLEDLQPFHAEEFVQAMFDNEKKE